MDKSRQFVTVAIAQRIKTGLETEYEKWISGITQACSNYPGYLGTNIIYPQPEIRPEYVTVLHFDGYDNLKTWMNSRDRQTWLTKAKPLIAQDPQIQEISGIEAWFSIPGRPLKTPPRHKTALLTWIVVYLLINLLNRLLSPILQNLPPWLAPLISSGIMVGLMTYIVMPRVTRLCQDWLYQKN